MPGLFALRIPAVGEERQGYSRSCELGDNAATKAGGTLSCVVAEAGIGFGMHEGKHVLVGGGNLQWQGADWTRPSYSLGRAQTMALAGFTAQALANETLLAFNSPREHPLVGGFVPWSIFSPIADVIRSEQAGPECFGDPSNFGDLTQRRVLEGGLIGVALLQALRLALDGRFPLFIRGTEQEVMEVFRLEFQERGCPEAEAYALFSLCLFELSVEYVSAPDEG